MADKLLPGHEKRPTHPIPEGPRPGTRYRVQDNDTWAVVASKHQVTVRDLIANNCGVNVSPEEINWYLRTRVGCNVSRDGRSWAFSGSASPGYIYVPSAGAVAPSAQNPSIRTLYGGPADLGCGGVEWLVEFQLPRPAEADGWVIQQVTRSYDIRKPDGSVADPRLNAPKAPFWEAWPVKKGATRTANRYDATDDGRTYDDSFDQPPRPALKGEFKVVAVVKFYEVALPSTFVKHNPLTRAVDLPSTTTRPDFWDGTGTARNLTVTWDCTNPARGSAPRIMMDVREKK